jgi:hypothetical protein
MQLADKQVGNNMPSQGKAQAQPKLPGPAPPKRNQNLSARAWLPDIPAYSPGNQVFLITFGCSPCIDIIVYYCHLCQFNYYSSDHRLARPGYTRPRLRKSGLTSGAVTGDFTRSFRDLEKR